MSSRTVTLFYVFLSVRLLTCGLFSHVIQDCERKCATEVEFVNEGGTALFCDRNCSLHHCRRGCSVYPDNVLTSCQRFCGAAYHENASTTGIQSWSHDEVRNCYQGCMSALEEYHKQIKNKLRNVLRVAPTLHTLNHSSLTLSWNGSTLENITYKIHKLLLDTNTGWQLHRQAVFKPDGKIDLFNLRPYVAYKFKILIVVTSVYDHLITSPETRKITTRAQGVPSSAPRIISASSPTTQAITITWMPPPFTNGRLLSYRIYLHPGRLAEQNLTWIDVPWNTTCWVIGQLRSSQKYVVSITAWNSQGEGPRISTDVVTLGADNRTTQDTPLLILASGNKILTVAITSASELVSQNSRVIYEHPDKTVDIIEVK